MDKNDPHRYDDIINLPHHVSETRPQMPLLSRAAQFAPFAALTGHDAAIRETARITEVQTELDEQEKALLDEKLRCIQDNLDERPTVTITFFQRDGRKWGGGYHTLTGSVVRIDLRRRILELSTGDWVQLDDITAIEGSLFDRCTEEPWEMPG